MIDPMKRQNPKIENMVFVSQSPCIINSLYLSMYRYIVISLHRLIVSVAPFSSLLPHDQSL